jgi:hypothetical protein
MLKWQKKLARVYYAYLESQGSEAIKDDIYDMLLPSVAWDGLVWMQGAMHHCVPFMVSPLANQPGEE